MDPGLVLGVHVVLVDGVLVGEGALHLADVVVDLLAAVLVDGAADGPDHAVLEPELHHAGEVVSVRGVHLQRTKQDRLTSVYMSSFSVFSTSNTCYSSQVVKLSLHVPILSLQHIIHLL